MYLGWLVFSRKFLMSNFFAASFGLVENKISKSVAFSDTISIGAKFVGALFAVFVGRFCEQIKILHKNFASASCGLTAFADFLQHFIGHTLFSFIPPSEKGVPAGTLPTRTIRKNNDVNHLAIQV